MKKGELTKQDCFTLGCAWESFRMGEVDQGIHILLPGRILGFAGAHIHNSQFETLCDKFAALPRDTKPEEFANVLTRWMRQHGVQVEQRHIKT